MTAPVEPLIRRAEPADATACAWCHLLCWWGTGLGTRLLEVAIGREPASLWVLEGNERARAFYRKHGFVEDGTRVDEPGFGVPEIRMVRRDTFTG